jgi:hypothetical protein
VSQEFTDKKVGRSRNSQGISMEAINSILEREEMDVVQMYEAIVQNL